MSSSDTLYLIIVIAVLGIGTLALVAAGAYIFLRVFSGVLSNKQLVWESSAEKIGAAVDRESVATYKPFTGERAGTKYTVSAYSLPRGRNGFDDYVQVEAGLHKPVHFPFEIRNTEYAYQQAAKFMERHVSESGGRSFENEFNIDCTDRNSLEKLLNIHIFEGENTSLMVDLLRIRSQVARLRVSNKSVIVGLRCEFGDAETIRKAIDHAVFLAGRIESARAAAGF